MRKRLLLVLFAISLCGISFGQARQVICRVVCDKFSEELKKMRKSLLLALFGISVCATSLVQAQQTIRGVVRDKFSEEPLPFATVTLQHYAVNTDSAGNFRLAGIPVGRYDLKVTFVGYNPVVVKEILVSSSKEAYLDIRMEESARALDEVVVKPTVSKARPLNNLALASARMLSVEEASRYAGGFDDPAHLATAFAGAAGNVGSNGIVIRGNAPKFLQWRLEDVEIPNPNHFAEVTGFGGGGLTAFSSQVLGNSDFFTGGFPAEYSNALSGVFDMNLRNGNNQKRENTVQLGLIGVDVASEGPLKRNAKASYIFNYRYSTLGLLASMLPEDASGTNYQDLSFKLNVPTAHAGTFSLWNIGLIDRSGEDAETDKQKWEYMQDKESQDVKQYMDAIGLSHKIRVGSNSNLKSTMAATVSGLDMHTERMNNNLLLVPQNVVKNTCWNFVLASSLTQKITDRYLNKAGVRFTGLKYKLLLKDARNDNPIATIADQSGFSSLLSAYTESSLHFQDNFTLNVGLSGQWFTLNNHFAIEPRAGIKWQFTPSQSVGISYGLHSRLEMLNYYFSRSSTGELVNKDLDFTRAHHLVLSYDYNIGENSHLRVEPYLQVLYSVPTIPDSSFSLINLKDDWFVNDRMVNQGKGLNYGIDITFEKYMSDGYYYMLTSSLFSSRYKAGDGIWRNTRFNCNFVFNLLAGKEWMVGHSRQNVFNLNARLTCQGGDRYSPVNLAASQREEDAVYDENKAYSKQLSPAFVAHFTASYRINRKKMSHEFALKVLNASAYKDYYGHRYNFQTKQVDAQREAVVVPNLSYKIEF